MDLLSLSTAPWQRLPPRLAAAMRPHLGATVGAVAEAIADIPAYAPIRDPKLGRDIRAGVKAAFDHFLDLVGTDEPALSAHLRELFVALGAAEAREERGPEALLAALRTASRLMLRAACDALSRTGALTPDLLVEVSDAVSVYVDELASASTDGFTDQLRAQTGESERARRHLAELLLRGGASPSVVSAAATAAGWRTIDAIVPVVLPLDQARDARFRFATDGVVAERARDAILLVRKGPRGDRAALTEAFRGRAAVIGPALPWAQAPEAVRLAELTARLAPAPTESTEDGQGPVFADDHLAMLAVRGEHAAFAVLSARRLAPMAALPAPQRAILENTLRSWLRHWGSRAEVAAELFIHPQTVSYRLKRLRDLYGDNLDNADVRFELAICLTHTGSEPLSAS